MNIRTLVAPLIGILALGLAAESHAASPCCGIVAVAASGAVTARDNSTGRTFQFQVTDRRLLATLQVGQSVHADFTTMRVSVQPDGIAPCCNISSVSPAGSAPPPVSSGREGEDEVLRNVDSARPCCNVVANTALRRLGRVVAAYPEQVQARIDVYRAGETRSLASGYGDKAFDLMPGTYDVEISGKRVAGVTVQAGHDTQLKVGVLRVTASDATRIDLHEPVNEKRFAGGYGTQAFGLPIGEVGVQIAGQTERVVIEAGRITEF